MYFYSYIKFLFQAVVKMARYHNQNILHVTYMLASYVQKDMLRKHASCYLHVVIRLYMHVSCNMYAGIWDTFHVCYMYMTCTLTCMQKGVITCMLHACTHPCIILHVLRHACHMHILYILHNDASLCTCKNNFLYYI